MVYMLIVLMVFLVIVFVLLFVLIKQRYLLVVYVLFVRLVLERQEDRHDIRELGRYGDGWNIGIRTRCRFSIRHSFC